MAQYVLIVFVFVGLGISGHLYASGSHHHEHQSVSVQPGGHHASLAGVIGFKGEVSRTIHVKAEDNMSFKHEPFNIKAGETIEFVVQNDGVLTHEFSIGTKEDHIKHGKMMIKNPKMHHGPGGSTITIASGDIQTLIWKFSQAEQVEIACNVPGHYQAGMHSEVLLLK